MRTDVPPAAAGEGPDGWAHLRARRRRSLVVFGLLAVVLALALVANLCVGSVAVDPAELIGILLDPRHGDTASQVVWGIRLPRIVAAGLLGGALGLAGLLLQTLFSNPIAGPYVLGISSGAKLAVALAMVAIVGGTGILASWMSMLAAFVGALAVMGLILVLARRVTSASTLIIVGVMIGYLCNAATELVVTFASDAHVASLRAWSQGSFSGIRSDQLLLLALVVGTGGLITFLLAKPLGAYQLGEAYAESVGVPIRRFRTATILLSSLLAACVAAFAGPVSFVGVAVPPFARRLLGTARPLLVIPAAFLTGSIVCLAADLVARCAFSPVELPVSTVTALFGAPVVIGVLLERRGRVRG